jgi:hypothetical protein
LALFIQKIQFFDAPVNCPYKVIAVLRENHSNGKNYFFYHIKEFPIEFQHPNAFEKQILKSKIFISEKCNLNWYIHIGRIFNTLGGQISLLRHGIDSPSYNKELLSIEKWLFIDLDKVLLVYLRKLSSDEQNS